MCHHINLITTYILGKQIFYKGLKKWGFSSYNMHILRWDGSYNISRTRRIRRRGRKKHVIFEASKFAERLTQFSLT